MSEKVRKVRARYTSFEGAKRVISDLSFWKEVLGAAYDEDNSFLYVQTRHQHFLKQWKKIEGFNDLKAWDTHEQVDSFAYRQGWTFVKGPALDVKKRKKRFPVSAPLEIKRMVFEGQTIEELEERLYSAKDVDGLGQITKERADLEMFAKNLDSIRHRIDTKAQAESLIPEGSEDLFGAFSPPLPNDNEGKGKFCSLLFSLF